MHLTYVFGVLGNAYPKGLQNIIVNIFDVVLKYGTMFPPHALAHIKPHIFFEFGAALHSCEYTAIKIHTVYLVTITELLHSHILCCPESTLITSQNPSCLLARQQDL